MAGHPLYRPPKIKQEIIYIKYIHKLSTPLSPKYAQCFPLNVHSKPRYGENPLSPIRFLPYIDILLGCGLIAKLGTKTRPNSEAKTQCRGKPRYGGGYFSPFYPHKFL
jgi:hypothetical protein